MWKFVGPSQYWICSYQWDLLPLLPSASVTHSMLFRPRIVGDADCSLLITAVDRSLHRLRLMWQLLQSSSPSSSFKLECTAMSCTLYQRIPLGAFRDATGDFKPSLSGVWWYAQMGTIKRENYSSFIARDELEMMSCYIEAAAFCCTPSSRSSHITLN